MGRLGPRGEISDRERIRSALGNYVCVRVHVICIIVAFVARNRKIQDGMSWIKRKSDGFLFRSVSA